MGIFFWFFLSVVGIFFFIILVSSVIGIPCLPTHPKQARLMIDLAGIEPGDKIIDLGAGHGRLLFLAAEKGARAVGYELNPFLVLYIWLKIKFKKTRGTVQIKWRSLFEADVSDADVVFCFLFPGYMDKLDTKLFSEMKSGSKIVAYVFPFSKRKHAHKEQGVSVYWVG